MTNPTPNGRRVIEHNLVVAPGRFSMLVDGLRQLIEAVPRICLRVDSQAEVEAAATELRILGIDATEAARFPEYAPDYFATFLEDPDGIRIEVTNYRQERCDRRAHWEASH